MGSRSRLASGVSSNLMRSALILLGSNKPGPFLREPFKTIEFWGSGQVIILIPIHPCFRFNRTPKGSAKGHAKRTKFERSDSAISAQAARAHRSISSWSCNGLFSLGNSLQGSNSTLKHSALYLIRPYERVPLLSLPTSLKWGRPISPGHREAPLLTSQLFKSSTCHSRLQTRYVLFPGAFATF